MTSVNDRRRGERPGDERPGDAPDVVWSPLERAIRVANVVVESGPSLDENREAVRGDVAAALNDRSLAPDLWPDEALDAIIEVARDLLDSVLGERDVDRAAGEINRLLEGSASKPRLSNHGGRTWHLHTDPVPLEWGSWFASSSALALALALSARGRVVWGRCRAVGCGRAFLDSGRGGPRLYCSSTCASRTRVAELRSRRRRESAA